MDNVVIHINEYRGKEMYNLAEKIFPYCRSITGEGVRKTISDINEYIEREIGIQFNIYDVPTGTRVFDWMIPKEWIIQDAYIEDEFGMHIIDMKENNLHVMGYSLPVDRWVELDELKKYIYTQPGQLDVIPYVTSYYKERYGFCMSQLQLEALPEGKYHMYIDSELRDGVLNYAELILPGRNQQEVFFSTYFCHPSMANNECSGPVLMAEIIRYVATKVDRKYTYRFVMLPETIGSLTYMSQKNNLEKMQKNVIAGFNLSCVGDDREYSIVESRYADTLSDKVLKNILKFHTNQNYKKYNFLQRGSDERQYNAPGIELPVVCFCRSKFGEYPEYHTSADNMDLVSPEGFQGSYEVMINVIEALEHNEYYKVNVLGEPQLGKRGLYPTVSQKGRYNSIIPIKNFIAYADGKNDLIDISNIVGISVSELIKVKEKLMCNNLIVTV